MLKEKKFELVENLKELCAASLFSEIPGIIFFKDLKGVYLGANQNFLELAGLNSSEELIGKTDHHLPWKNQEDAIRKNDLKVLQIGQILQGEEMITAQNTAKIFMSIRRPLKDKAGETLGLAVIWVDITSIKTFAHRLEQDKNKMENEKNIAVSYLNNIVRCTPGNLYWKDLEGHYLGANDFFLEVAGLKTLDELLGKTDLDLPWHDQYKELRKNDLDVMRSGQSMSTEESVILSNQTKKTFMVAKMPLKDSEGNIIGIVGNSLDITHQKEIEEAHKIAQEKAEVANRAKTRFLEDMRHDFRTPFTGILGMASILYETEASPDRKELIDGIVQSAQVLLDQLNEITNFIAIEKGDMPVLEKQFDLHKVMKDIESLLMPGVQVKNLNLIITTEAPQYLIGDLLRTQRVLMNLLTNAIKFTHEGSISLEASIGKRENDVVVIKFKIEDTGIGMHQKAQDIIFEKFSRLNPSYEGLYGGKGLGLRIVKQFLDELNGEIHLTSQPNKGSTFVVLIPYKLPLLNCDEKELLMQ